MIIKNKNELKFYVEQSLRTVRVIDMHTHLFPKCFGELFLYDVDDLLTYHYLIGEALVASRMPYEKYWTMSKKEQADFIWKTLFIDNIPISESARSILTIFQAENLDINRKDINYFRNYFKSVNIDYYIDRVFKIVNLDYVVMTNDPFNKYEEDVWDNSSINDERFYSSLRLDVLLNEPDEAFKKLNDKGYLIHMESGKLTDSSFVSIKQFLNDQISAKKSLYCAVSLPPTFSMNDGSIRSQIIEKSVLPCCREKSIPVALMIGVKRNVNKRLIYAGSVPGKADMKPLYYLFSKYPENKFLVTMLSDENQHELTACGRIFNNMMIFGCWWYLNNPSIEEKLTEIRLEMLGSNFIAQHSDACILGQLISKWQHYKQIIGDVLYKKYACLVDSGYNLTDDRINEDVYNLFGGNFTKIIKK